MNTWAYTTELAKAQAAADDVARLIREAGQYGYSDPWKARVREAQARLADLQRQFELLRPGL